MFDFLRRSSVRRPSTAVCRALEQIGVETGADTLPNLGVVEKAGTYAGRRVTFISVFDRVAARARGVKVSRYDDVDANPDLAVATGYIDEDGTVLIHPATAEPAATAAPRRVQVKVHDDDARVVARGERR